MRMKRNVKYAIYSVSVKQWIKNDEIILLDLRGILTIS